MLIMALKKYINFILLVIFVLIQYGFAAVPATFFWKPRVGIDLTVPETEQPPSLALPTRARVQEGVVVMIDGYEAGMTIMAIASGATSADVYPTLNPLSAYFYTNAYRWSLRKFSMMPPFLGGSKTYYESLELWKRRFYFLDTFMPKFMRKVFPYIKKEEWEKEEREMAYFKRYAESAFGKGYRYPNKKFNNFRSWETVESMENLDLSSTSLTLQG